MLLFLSSFSQPSLCLVALRGTSIVMNRNRKKYLPIHTLSQLFVDSLSAKVNRYIYSRKWINTKTKFPINSSFSCFNQPRKVS